jgi:hypothetical protein
MRRALYPGLLLAVAAAAAGCQGEKPPYTFAPVEGTVTKDGKPLPGVFVIFWGDEDAGTKQPLSSGSTDSAGHYHLHTEQGQDGAVVGRHRVCIRETGPLVQRFAGNRPANKQLPGELPAAGPAEVPPAYGRREQTPLRAEMRPGAPVLDVEVK